MNGGIRQVKKKEAGKPYPAEDRGGPARTAFDRIPRPTNNDDDESSEQAGAEDPDC